MAFVRRLLLKEFLSTLSAWRATVGRQRRTAPEGKHFYPRSPHGERLLCRSPGFRAHFISIHALRMESDTIVSTNAGSISARFLSTLSAWRATGASSPGCRSPTGRFLSTLSAWRATANYNKILRRFREKCEEIYKIESAIAY